jgi:hypothetical protein
MRSVLVMFLLLCPTLASATPTSHHFDDTLSTFEFVNADWTVDLAKASEPNLFWPLAGLIGLLALSVAYTRR